MYPKLVVDLDKIRHNTETVASTARDISVIGVTKGCAGSIPVAQAMIDGGVVGLADSRIKHLQSLRNSFPGFPLMCLRQPMLDEAHVVININATALISDLEAAATLGTIAAKRAGRQKILVMIETGGDREGIDAADFFTFVNALLRWPSLEIIGIGTNTGCANPRVRGNKSLLILDRLAREATRRGLDLKIISAGNSSCWNMLETGQLPESANQLRFGEVILLGLETFNGRPIPALHQDAFTVRVEILEVVARGEESRLVLAIGCQDIGRGQLLPVDERLSVTKMTSDHCVIRAEKSYKVKSGDNIKFMTSYYALQALSASAYVQTAYIGYNRSTRSHLLL